MMVVAYVPKICPEMHANEMQALYNKHHCVLTYKSSPKHT